MNGVLSERQREVLDLVKLGLRNGEIAEVLYISPRTVDSHMKALYDRTGARTRVELASVEVR